MISILFSQFFMQTSHHNANWHQVLRKPDEPYSA